MTPHLSAQAGKRLRGLPALRGLDAADRERVAELFHEEFFRKGDVVFREGDPGTTLYIVHAGAVEVLAGVRSVARLGPGEWFGEMSLITGAARSATVAVILDCHVLTLDAEAFSRLLTIQPRLYEQLAAILSQRLALTSRGDAARWRSEIILIDNRARWEDRRALVEALAAALERELGREVAIVSVGRRTAPPAGGPRPGRPDTLLGAGKSNPDVLRARLAAQLAALAHIPVILVEVDERLEAEAALSQLADTVIVLADGATPPKREPGSQRHITLYDRRLGPTPPLCSSSAAVLPLDDRWRAWTIGHLARCVTHRTIGIALGSGVAYGLAHIGVLAVLEEAGIPIDFVAGSSIGAIVGAAYALGMSATELRLLVEGLAHMRSARSVLQTLLLLARDANLMRPGLLAGDRLVALLESFAPVRKATFADLVIPYRAVATDLETGACVELLEGTLADAMRASASAPWLLSPWRIGDRVLIDGGMCDPVPSTTVRGMGADLVIAVNVVPPLDPRAQNPLAKILGAVDWLNPLSYLEGRWRLPNSFDVVMKSLLILQHELGNSRIGEADVLVKPALGEFWFLEFWNAPALIAKGAEAARAAVPAIRQKLGNGELEASPATAASSPAR